MLRTSTRRPIVGLALSVCAGTLFGLVYPVAFGPAIVAAAAIWTIGMLALRGAADRVLKARSSWIPDVCIHAAAVLLAAASAAQSISGLYAASAFAADRSRNSCELIGVIADEPSATPVPQASASLWRFPLTLEASRPAPDAAWERTRGDIQVRWQAGSGGITPRYGDRWIVRGNLVLDAGRWPSTPSATPRYRCYAVRARSQWLSGGHGAWALDACYAARKTADAYLSRGIESHTAAVNIIRALLLGYPNSLAPDVRQDFTSTGTIHIIAISGLQVGMVAGILVAVLGACGISRVRWILVLTPALVAYTIATGLSPSALRSCVMALIFFAAPFLKRHSDGLSALSLAAVAILAVNPAALFDISFILSFTAVLGLILLYPSLARTGSSLFHPDPLRLQPEATRVRFLRGAARQVWSLLAASLAASLFTIPITAYCFGIVSVIGLLGNLIAVPVSFLIVFAGCLSLAFGACAAVMAEVFNHANLFLVGFLLKSMNIMAALPASHFAMARPSWVSIAGWYVSLALLVVALKLKMDKVPETP